MGVMLGNPNQNGGARSPVRKGGEVHEMFLVSPTPKDLQLEPCTLFSPAPLPTKQVIQAAPLRSRLPKPSVTAKQMSLMSLKLITW